jgi:hypothetical protein
MNNQQSFDDLATFLFYAIALALVLGVCGAVAEWIEFRKRNRR